MKKFLVFISITFSTNIFAQTEIDTIIINDYHEYAVIHGPGKGKVVDTAWYEIANDSIYYWNSGYYKNSDYNYIIVKDNHGKIKYEGVYFNFYRDGIYIEYDKMERKIVEGYYSFQPGKYVKVKRKKMYQPAHSIKVGTWLHYGYENYKDTIGYIK
jgi:hypothetical protein